MRLALSNLALPPFHHLSVLPHLRALGVQGLEVAPDHTWPRTMACSGFSALDVDVYRKAAKAAELPIVGLHALIGGRPELGLFEDIDARRMTVEHLVHLSGICRDLGGQTLILDSRWKRELPVKEAWLQCRELLERVLPRIEDHGTILCFAPLAPNEGDFCAQARECYMMANAIDHPSFGLHLSTAALAANNDSGHANFAAARGRLDHFHIDEPARAPLGSSGGVDHIDMRRHLSAVTYKKWVSIVQSHDRSRPVLDAVSDAVAFFTKIYVKAEKIRSSFNV